MPAALLVLTAVVQRNVVGSWLDLAPAETIPLGSILRYVARGVDFGVDLVAAIRMTVFRDDGKIYVPTQEPPLAIGGSPYIELSAPPDTGRYFFQIDFIPPFGEVQLASTTFRVATAPAPSPTPTPIPAPPPTGDVKVTIARNSKGTWVTIGSNGLVLPGEVIKLSLQGVPALEPFDTFNFKIIGTDGRVHLDQEPGTRFPSDIFLTLAAPTEEGLYTFLASVDRPLFFGSSHAQTTFTVTARAGAPPKLPEEETFLGNVGDLAKLGIVGGIAIAGLMVLREVVKK